MKNARSLVLGLSVLCATLGGAAGCAQVNTAHGWLLRGNVLTYDQYLSIDQSAKPTPTAENVIQTLGKPMSVHDRDGIRRRIDYHCYSLNDDLKIAEFTFDENEKLVKKELW